MAPVPKSKTPKTSSLDDNIEEVYESREFVIRKSVDLHKTVVKRSWLLNATKKMKTFINHQRSLKKSERCSVQEIDAMLKMLPRNF